MIDKRVYILDDLACKSENNNPVDIEHHFKLLSEAMRKIRKLDLTEKEISDVLLKTPAYFTYLRASKLIHKAQMKKYKCSLKSEHSKKVNKRKAVSE